MYIMLLRYSGTTDVEVLFNFFPSITAKLLHDGKMLLIAASIPPNPLCHKIYSEHATFARARNIKSDETEKEKCSIVFFL